MKIVIEDVTVNQLVLLSELIDSVENDNKTTLGGDVCKKIVVLEKCKSHNRNDSSMIFDVKIGIREHYGDVMFRKDAKEFVSRDILMKIMNVLDVFPEQ